MTIREFTTELNSLFQIQQAEDFDNVGLLCGNPERDVSGVLVCHDALENVVDEAIAKNCNIIVAFHPIIFSGLQSITGKNYVERAVLKALENKIAIYAVHTAFDNDFKGVNRGICQHLGLENIKILMPKSGNLEQLVVYAPEDYTEKIKEALFSAGAGKLGFYDECSFTVSGKGSFRPLEHANPYSGTPGVREEAAEDMISVIFEKYKKNAVLQALKNTHPYEEIAYQIYELDVENHYSGLGMFGDLSNALDEEQFLQFLKEKFNLKIIKHSTLLSKKIKKVGVLGGSGASGIKAAIAQQCDAYITGDLKYHDYFLAEDKILLADLGHFESEQWVTQQLVEILSEKFTTFAVLKSTENTNPVNYFL